MPKVEGTKRFLLQERNITILNLHRKGYSDLEIGEIMNGMDRTWVYRIRRSMKPKQKKA